LRYSRAAVLLASHRIFFAVLLLFLSSRFFCAQLVGSSEPSAARYVLTGTVVSSATGAGIPYALVQLDQSAKLADQNGNFRFENLISTTVNLQAHKPGFFQENELAEPHAPAPNVVTLSSPSTNLVVRLVPEAVISGHVANPEGEPVDGLPVLLRFGENMNGRRVWQQHGNRATDEDGNFRIADLRPGTYFVEVGPNMRARPLAEKEKSEVIPALYYPGVRELSAATPLRILPGQRVNLEFTTRRVPAYRVSGAVTGITGNSGGLRLLDQDGESTNVPIRLDPRTGRFDAFPIPAGTYHLRFNGRDFEGTELYADVPLNVNGDLPELRIPVVRTMTIPVEYQSDYSKPESTPSPSIGMVSGGGRFSNNRRMHSAQLRLVSRKPPYQQFWAGSRTAGGVEAFRGLEAGTYDVEVESLGYGYVSSITCGGRDLLREPLILADGSDPQPIQVVTRDDGASLSGSVQIANSAQFAQVLMIDEDSGVPPRQVFVNGSGTFQVQGLAPGRYDIMAFDRLDGIEYRNREALSAYLSHAAHVTLSADEQAKVTVDLIRTRE